MSNTEVIARAIGIACTAHVGQIRKYTGEPYIVHPIAVAALVREVTDDPEVVAAAYLHDVLEDTEVTFEDLVAEVGPRVAAIVAQLTDVFTPQAYPHLGRAQRKALEADRMRHVSPEARLVKRADITDNSRDIEQHDPKFAVGWLAEKDAVLGALTHAELKGCGYVDGNWKAAAESGGYEHQRCGRKLQCAGRERDIKELASQLIDAERTAEHWLREYNMILMDNERLQQAAQRGEEAL